MNIIVRLLIRALAVLITAYFLPGVEVINFWTALLVATVLVPLNFLVKPILLLLTLPINILTFGFFTLVINTLIILLTDYLVPGFSVDSFLAGFIFSLLFSLVSSLLFNLQRG